MNDAQMEGALMAESIIVQRQVAALPGAVDLRTRQQVDVLASSQQLMYDQLKAFWDEHQALRRDTGEALGQANEVLQQQHATEEALCVAVEHQAKLVAQQQEQLQAALAVLAHHQEQLHAASAAFQAQQHEVSSLKQADAGKPVGNVCWRTAT
jgi:hypothetical protein